MYLVLCVCQDNDGVFLSAFNYLSGQCFRECLIVLQVGGRCYLYDNITSIPVQAQPSGLRLLSACLMIACKGWWVNHTKKE